MYWVGQKVCEDSLVAQKVESLPAMWETRVQFLGREDSLEKEITLTPVPLPGKSHGWRSLVGYSPWRRKELDATERLHFQGNTQINILANTIFCNDNFLVKISFLNVHN